MPQDGSACATALKPRMAWVNQNEWSSATARVKSACTAGLHVVGKLTVPSRSWGWVAAGTAARTRVVTRVSILRFIVLPPPMGGNPRRVGAGCQGRAAARCRSGPAGSTIPGRGNTAMQYRLMCCIDEERWGRLPEEQRARVMREYDELLKAVGK